ncbi:MAG TPA: DUF3443 family protein [Steroidobacteraceae bacterium]|jgi:hypothetical protein|nr:DUF3443 family protein [Steroidobacteraceae bacterium]
MISLRSIRWSLGLGFALSAISCGGGGGGGGGTTPPPPPPASVNNTASVIVDQGPSGISVNTLFTSVTVCAPGSTTNCQTIDHVQVDTGSYGLRILAPVLTVSLPVEMLSNGNTVAECTQFVDGFTWGPIETADVQIAGETAKSVPVQAIGDSRYSNVPTDCSSTGPAEDTVASFGANAILGIGPFEIDQPACADSAISACYYACATATSCSNSAVPTAMLVANPVTRFAVDNNGSIIVLPSVASAGELTVSGSLIFGIDTQSDNQSGTQTVLTVDQNADLLMTYNGQPLADSFIDSGSNGIYFNDPNIVKCTAPPNDPTSQITMFYCPATTLSLGLGMQGMNGVMANNLTFEVGNAITMLNANPTFNAFPLLAGTNPNTNSFDYGLAFFYGRRVAIAVEGNMTSAGTGPYIAF